MTINTVDYTGRFADFMSKTFPNATCPPLPKKASDLPATIEMALQNEDPALYQNLFGGKSGALPADVQIDLIKTAYFQGTHKHCERMDLNTMHNSVNRLENK